MKRQPRDPRKDNLVNHRLVSPLYTLFYFRFCSVVQYLKLLFTKAATMLVFSESAKVHLPDEDAVYITLLPFKDKRKRVHRRTDL